MIDEGTAQSFWVVVVLTDLTVGLERRVGLRSEWRLTPLRGNSTQRHHFDGLISMRRVIEDKIVERQKRQTELDVREVAIGRERIRLEGEIAAYMDVLSSLPAMPDLPVLEPQGETPTRSEETTADLDGQIPSSRLSDWWLGILRGAVTKGNGTVDIDGIVATSEAINTPVDRGNARSQMASRTNAGDFIRLDPGVFRITEKGRASLGLGLFD